MYQKTKAWLVLSGLVVSIKVFSLFPQAVETCYAAGIYPIISRCLRFLFGWIPFSMGDVLYAAAALYLLLQLGRLLRDMFKKKIDKAYCRLALKKLVFYCMVIYAVFNICWGLNYNRQGMASQLQLQLKPYSTAALQKVMQVILERLNTVWVDALPLRDEYLQHRRLFDQSYQSYQLAESRYPQLSYSGRSVKASLFGILGNYLGYTGYYNPFTGEAQVNTTVPVFVQPFTTCHEMGHQLGYAKENEANFAGYLSAKSSADATFRYSVYLELYQYGIGELYRRDSAMAIALNRQKPLQVKKDMLALREFYSAYTNPVEPYIKFLYSHYLKANQQPSGMQSYNEVMAFLVAYYQKYGEAAL